MSAQLAFVFPGQGSQEVGMLAELAAIDGVVARTFAEASEVLGFDLWQLVASGPEVELNRTINTQPALLAASVALWRVWDARGGAMPGALAGHSLGEYAALVCGGALEFADAVRLVRRRGELMQLAVPEGEGAMAAILGLEDEVIFQCCGQAAGVVAPANFNSPGQVVIAGSAAAVDQAIELCKAAGAKRAMRLAVSVPSHCALMRPAAEQLAAALEQVPLQAPRIPVLHNVDAAPAATPAEIRRRLVAQLHEPVQWTRCVEALRDAGASQFIECGPGRVLAGLVRRIDRGLHVESIGTPAALQTALTLTAGGH